MSTSTGEPMVTVRGLRAGYGGHDVVEDVHLTVQSGEIVGLLGRNGAGKSTTLLAIAGVLPGAAGELRVDGRRVSGPAHRRSRTTVGLVPEGRSIFPSLSVRENLAIAGVDSDAACEIFPELRQRLSIRSGLLSGGEQQMLALVRAMLRRPRLLLIDELSFGLSQAVSERLLERLREFVMEHRTAVVLVEQHLVAMSRVADRVYVMQDGRIRLELEQAEIARRSEEIASLYLSA
jgi:branched-chain amino acid transport system ATP-binding protein